MIEDELKSSRNNRHFGFEHLSLTVSSRLVTRESRPIAGRTVQQIVAEPYIEGDTCDASALGARFLIPL
jgi:hypothetical protein